MGLVVAVAEVVVARKARHRSVEAVLQQGRTGLAVEEIQVAVLSRLVAGDHLGSLEEVFVLVVVVHRGNQEAVCFQLVTADCQKENRAAETTDRCFQRHCRLSTWRAPKRLNARN